VNPHAQRRGIGRSSDPKLKSESRYLQRPLDQPGYRHTVDGDNIYNGAVDNATGSGILLELARAWAAQTAKPRRSALFLSVTAEEGGLRGSEYYPTSGDSRGKDALAINYDGLFPFGRPRDIVLNGAERTTGVAGDRSGLETHGS